MSNGLKVLIKDLQGNLEVVGNFFDNPEQTLDNYGIQGIERQALLAKDINALNSIGIEQQELVGALSGAHSSGCHEQA
ncbi:hypothetical protein OL233_04535 [Vagococcus sp. PNs007]|uniref:Uncharacterized protein n=1 Tax=Vagococcus proximus TaxID=2991417 RepID=A0ABT5X0M6_9ENTE|nr:hypothetical protein [Vagococcus proximus]MDF0479550.1 hypothetical protein [Vagococcus proximus]